MKKKLLLFVFLFNSLLIQSCQKDDISQQQSKPNPLLSGIQWDYYTYTKDFPFNKEYLNDPIWDSTKILKTGDTTLLEVPIRNSDIF